MYNLDKQDFERMSVLHALIKHHHPWMDDFIEEQKTPVEYEIQKYWASRVDLIDKHVAILNSGIGYYSVPFAFQRGAKTVHTYDMDPTTAELCWTINGSYWESAGYSHHQRNITFDHELINHKFDIYVNTSCEHSYPIGELLEARAKNRMCVLSANNLSKRGHINLIRSIDEFKEQAQLSKVINEDYINFIYEDDLGEREYTQFFLIGIK